MDQAQGLTSHAPQPLSGSLISNEIANLLGIPNAKGSIPASILSKAPHLIELSDAITADSHLETTQDLIATFSPQLTQDTLIAKAQFAPVTGPLLCTIW